MQKDDQIIVNVLKEAGKRGISFFLDKGKLKYSMARDGGIDQEFIEEIRKYKEEIKILLGGHSYGEIDWDNIRGQRQALSQLPLSFAQERLWFIDRFQGSRHYHIPWVLRLDGPLNVTALANAFGELVNRHEVLRTVIREHEGIGYQQVLNKDTFIINEVDGRHYADNYNTLTAAIDEWINTPFDLSLEPMLRVQLLELGDHEHILIIVVHHIAADGSSWSVLIRELSALYASAVTGKQIALPKLSIQYADYALWQRQWLQGEVLVERLAYWRRQVSGVPVLDLPVDYTRPPMQSNRGAFIFRVIDKTIERKLRQLVKAEGATLFMALLAAFKVMLYRYSGQEDICVGSPVAGRMHQETEVLIGLFVNTLALRTDLRGDPSFRELLARVQQTALEAYEHQDVPFEKVVEAVVTERDVNRNPVFQVMFSMQMASDAKEFLLEAIKVKEERIGGGSYAKFDLTMTAMETDNGLGIHINYCRDLYKEQTIERMLRHYETLLHSIVHDPGVRIGELKMLDEEEERRLLNEFNNTQGDYPRDKTLVDLLEAQATRTPEAVAVVFSDQRLSYRELQQRSNRLAHYLRKHGIREDGLVAICVERSIEMIIGILGILKAGGAYVPIDPEYPAERIAYILSDTGANMVVSTRQGRSTLPGSYQGHMVLLDEQWEQVQQEPDTLPVIALQPGHLAYIIYTSGSTGRPKGVMIEHRNVVALLAGFEAVAGNDGNGAGLAICPYAFDVSVWEYFINLCSGNALHILESERVFDPASLVNYIIANQITTAYLPPTILEEIAAVLQSVNSPICLKRLLVGVMPIRQGTLQQIQDAVPALKIINGYGPTETTVCASFFHFRNATDARRNTPIGKPVSNYAIYIVDALNNLLPVGIPGELCIGGAGVGRGYWNNIQLTKDKFIINPFSSDPAAIMYRTGDLAKWLPDGNIEYLGRKDDQVKIRGYRIELGEIENTIQQSGLTAQHVVATKTDADGNKLLAAYVVPLAGAFDRSALINFLRARLPEYMVPAVWVELESMPLTANGKVDKKALMQMDSGHRADNAYEAPRNELEQALADSWAELLKIERVGINDNFFSLGGHSLLIIPLVKRIPKLQYQLHFKDVFKYQTIAQLSAMLAMQQTAGRGNGDRYIHLLNKDTDKPFLFMLPGSPGFIDGYHELGGYFEDTFTVFGVQLVGLLEQDQPLKQLGEIAQFARQCIQQVQPHGPYRLAGHSLGGLLAFEIVKQLESMGEKVEFLIMLDTLIDAYRIFMLKAGKNIDEILIDSICFFLKNYGVIDQPFPQWITDMKHSIVKAAEADKPGIIMQFVRERIPDNENKALYLRVANNTLVHSLMNYRPVGKIHAEMLFIKAAEENWEYDEWMGWKDHAPGMKVITSPGTHVGCIKGENAGILAQKIKENLLT